MGIGQAGWNAGKGYGRTRDMATNDTTTGIGMDSEALLQVEWEGSLPAIDYRQWTEAFDEFWRKRNMPLSHDVRGRPIYERDTTNTTENI